MIKTTKFHYLNTNFKSDLGKNNSLDVMIKYRSEEEMF